MRFSLWTLCLFLTLAPVPLVFAEVPSLSFPPRIGSLEFSETTDYEKKNQGSGTGWSYYTRGIKADVYLYTGGLASVPSDLSSPTIAGHFQQVIGGVYEMQNRGQYSDVRTITPEEKIYVGSVPFLHAELKFTQNNEPRISHVYLTVWKNQFLKIRFTYFASEQKAGAKALAEFLPAIVKVFESAR